MGDTVFSARFAVLLIVSKMMRNSDQKINKRIPADPFVYFNLVRVSHMDTSFRPSCLILHGNIRFFFACAISVALYLSENGVSVFVETK